MSLKQVKKDNKLFPKYYGPYKVLQKIWYYGIQIGASYFFVSASDFLGFMLKEGYR